MGRLLKYEQNPEETNKYSTLVGTDGWSPTWVDTGMSLSISHTG